MALTIEILPLQLNQTNSVPITGLFVNRYVVVEHRFGGSLFVDNAVQLLFELDTMIVDVTVFQS